MRVFLLKLRPTESSKWEVIHVSCSDDAIFELAEFYVKNCLAYQVAVKATTVA